MSAKRGHLLILNRLHRVALRKLFVGTVVIFLFSLGIFFASCEGRPVYKGISSDTFVIRWAFQDFCSFVYDVRLEIWATQPYEVTFDASKVQPGDSIFVRNAKRFYKEVHPHIKNPYIIIMHGDRLEMMENSPWELLDDPLIIAWFGIHPNGKKHRKYYPIPLGILQVKEFYKNRATWNAYFSQLRINSEKKTSALFQFWDR